MSNASFRSIPFHQNNSRIGIWTKIEFWHFHSAECRERDSKRKGDRRKQSNVILKIDSHTCEGCYAKITPPVYIFLLLVTHLDILLSLLRSYFSTSLLEVSPNSLLTCNSHCNQTVGFDLESTCLPRNSVKDFRGPVSYLLNCSIFVLDCLGSCRQRPSRPETCWCPRPSPVPLPVRLERP